MKKFQNYAEYLLIRIVQMLFSGLPLGAALAFGKGIGLFTFSVLRIRRRVAIENIARSFPEKSPQEVQAIARRTFMNFGQSIMEFMRLPRTSPRELQERVKFINAHLLAEGEQAGKGVILLSGHFGNWELMGAAIRALGYPISAIAREQRNNLVNDLINRHRHAVGIETIKLGMALRGILKALRDRRFVALLADQDAHDEGVFVNFLGRPSATATGPAVFALKTGAALIFGTCVRGEKGHHTIHFQQIDFSDLNGLTEENIRILTQRHATALEECIRRWPDHWFWMHKRWKTKPRQPRQNENTGNAIVS